MRTRWTLFPLLCLWASAQDQNWGKKVKCYMVEGMAMCPGCNSRAGLICPRVIPDESNCDDTPPTPRPPIDERTQRPPPPAPTTVEETSPPTEIAATPARTTPEIDIDPDEKVGGKHDKDPDVKVGGKHDKDPDVKVGGKHDKDPDEKVGGEHDKPLPIDMQIFLYQLLQNSNAWKRPYTDIPRRFKRRAAQGEICQWNGDCPCPQICCGNGDNKAKTCKMGIRLPPPWGG